MSFREILGQDLCGQCDEFGAGTFFIVFGGARLGDGGIALFRGEAEEFAADDGAGFIAEGVAEPADERIMFVLRKQPYNPCEPGSGRSVQHHVYLSLSSSQKPSWAL